MLRPSVIQRLMSRNMGSRWFIVENDRTINGTRNAQSGRCRNGRQTPNKIRDTRNADKVRWAGLLSDDDNKRRITAIRRLPIRSRATYLVSHVDAVASVVGTDRNDAVDRVAVANFAGLLVRAEGRC